MVQDSNSIKLMLDAQQLYLKTWLLASFLISLYFVKQVTAEQEVKFEVSISSIWWYTLINEKHQPKLYSFWSFSHSMQPWNIFFFIFYRLVYGNNFHGLTNYFKRTFYNFKAYLNTLFTICPFIASFIGMKGYRTFSYRSTFCFIDCTTT